MSGSPTSCDVPSRRILIDGRYLLGPHRGISIFTLNLLQNLPATCNQYFLILPLSLKGRLDPSLDKFTLIFLPFFGHLIWEQLVVPLAILVLKPWRFYTPNGTGPLLMSPQVSYFATIHDVSFLMPDNMPLTLVVKPYKLLGRIYRSLVTSSIIKKYDRLCTVSESAFNDIIHIFPSVEKKLTVIQHGRCVHERSPTCKHRALVCITGSDPQKNFSRLYQALNRLPDLSGWTLHVVGLSSKQYKQKLTNQLSIIYYPFLSNDAVRSLLDASYACLLPSLHESFGLPIVEAINASCHVFASNTGAFMEVAGSCADYFDPASIESISNTVNRRISLFPSPLHIESKRSFERRIRSWSSVAADYAFLLTN